jgi:16S rRNA (guanine966-N2)-methyltransferase
MQKTALRDKSGTLRIIAGAWRGRKIEVPAGDKVRPTSDRVREALFNRLVHGFAETSFRLPGAHVADVFAGAGALGLEALSRGASHATFIEKDLNVAEGIRRNIAKLGAEDRSTVLVADGAKLPLFSVRHNLVLADPPYGEDLIGAMLASLSLQEWLTPDALICIESEVLDEVAEQEGFKILDRRTYGRSAITVLQKTTLAPK